MFAILFEVLLIEIQEEIHHFAGWDGGVKKHNNCEIKIMNKLAFPIFDNSEKEFSDERCCSVVWLAG